MPKIMLNSVEYTGGGGDSGMELTYDEYLALSEEEKNNGTTYYINDINGAGKDQFQPVIYSEEEREIGVWTDGKPLYEKTVTFTNVSRTGVIDLNLINVDNIFLHDGKYRSELPLPYVHSDMSNGIGGFFEIDSNGKWIWNVRGGSYASSVTGWMTVRYTKTTDQPGSGTWTPQGVPAVHYSENEQVVGTWIDGSPMYEKTIEYTPSSTITSSVTVGTIANTDKYFLVFATAYKASDDRGILLPFVSGNAKAYFSFQNGAIKLNIENDSWNSDWTFYITIRYTKQTTS